MKKQILTTTALVGFAGLFAGGCATDPTDVSLGAVTGNLTPEAMTLNQRPDDVRRHAAYAIDVNGRLFWEDLGRTFYTDHPSHLNPIEIMSVSGKPR